MPRRTIKDALERDRLRREARLKAANPGRGRPKHVPTPKQRQNVELMAALGINHDHMAKIIGICDKTLRSVYTDELELGKSKVDAMVGSNIIRQAVKDDLRASPWALFYAARQMGWKEIVRQEQTGVDGGPIEMRDVSARELIASRIARIADRSTKGGDPS